MTRENKEKFLKAYIVYNEKKNGGPSTNPYLKFRPMAKETKAAGLESLVCEYIINTGGRAERIKNQGRFIHGDTIINPHGGVVRTGGTWIKGTGTDGTPDVHATKLITIGRRTVPIGVKIEVKIGKDRLSESQKKYKAETERLGEHYLVVKNFDSFIEQWEKII